MCTAATYKTDGFYFGRTFDYEFSYGEDVTIMPRNYELKFKRVDSIKTHYAIIGMAFNFQGYPLYYDGMNEMGLCMAGLNFVGNAYYRDAMEGYDNICQAEFISWVLSQCANIDDVKILLKNLNITRDSFSDELPIAELHWIISDKDESITVESVKEGIKIYNNPVGILTNNPPFDVQMFNLNNYMNLSSKNPENHFCSKLKLNAYSRGMGALGLPGDLSSLSRFVRAAYVKSNSQSGEGEEQSVSQFFHILDSVNQQRGCCILQNDECQITIYTCCCSTDSGVYYYTTYDNHQISAVDMRRENLDGSEIIKYELITSEQFNFQN